MVGYYDPVSSEEIKMANGNGEENLRWPVTDTFVPQNIRAFIETVDYFLQTTSGSMKKVSFSVENESYSAENESRKNSSSVVNEQHSSLTNRHTDRDKQAEGERKRETTLFKYGKFFNYIQLLFKKAVG